MGYIPKRHWPICQQGSRQNGQSRIFGTCDTHFPCQGRPAVNFQLIHESHCGCVNSLMAIAGSGDLQIAAHGTEKKRQA
jgi:hypothetical protein